MRAFELAVVERLESIDEAVRRRLWLDTAGLALRLAFFALACYGAWKMFGGGS